jgi:hypothetical protein
MKVIKFKTGGWSSALGAFETGGIARVSDEMARHMVEDAMCAEYVKEPEEMPEPEEKTIKRGRPAKGEK